MSRWWVSWYSDGVFEYHGPWWISGYELDGTGRATMCAAVLAPDEDAARQVIIDAHDSSLSSIEWRFVGQRPPWWNPFSDRFPRAAWMKWPAEAP